MRILLPVICLVSLLLCSSMLSAADISSNAGTSAFPFLKIDVGARAVSMGSAFTGLADDEMALYYNPAGIARFEEKRFIAEYHSYFAGLNNGVIGVILPNRKYVLGFHINYLSYGTFTQTDLAGNITGEFGGSDMLFAGTFAINANEEFSLGGTAKFIYEKISSYSATGAAFDLGARFHSARDRYNAGIMLQNVGVQLSALGSGDKAKLPLSVRLGGSVRPYEIPAIISADLIVPIDNKPVIALGTDVYQFKPLFIRMGWNSFGSNYRAEGSSDHWAGFSIGAGFEYHKYEISYAFSPAADLGESHRITLSGGF